jgi:hypothetical protein
MLLQPSADAIARVIWLWLTSLLFRRGMVDLRGVSCRGAMSVDKGLPVYDAIFPTEICAAFS